jgi:hypothetical protein
MPPERTDLILTSYIPYSERDVLILNGLDVESWAKSGFETQRGTLPVLTDRRNGSDDLAKFQLIQDSCFTSGIKTDLQKGRSISIS